MDIERWPTPPETMWPLRSRDPAPPGRVTLVGAGPGDPDLLTLKAVRALQSADVVLFDDLVSDAVLALVRQQARRLLVGKRAGRLSCRQDDINERMVRLARQGHHVVRLKSGDPMVFGRAGEEIAQLSAAGIAVEVVPGITSAMAMAASLKVSLTHRDCSQSVTLITGHARNGALPADLDWQGLARASGTLVFYMGARTAAQIATCLMAAQMSPATPVVVGRSVSHPDQAFWLGQLATLARGVADIGFDRPVLIGIGAVFADAVVAAEVLTGTLPRAA